MLTQLEISFPGSLRLHVLVNPGDQYGTSEFSPVELIQPLIIGVCAALMAWVARYCPSQRPIAIPFGGLALVFLIRECDYFLDRHLADNLWQVLVSIICAFVIVYIYRVRKRLRIAWGRVWPSPGQSGEISRSPFWSTANWKYTTRCARKFDSAEKICSF